MAIVIAHKAERPLYYLEGIEIYKVGDGPVLVYDTIPYESCKPFLRYKEAEECLKREVRNFYENGSDEVEPMFIDLEIIEYR